MTRAGGKLIEEGVRVSDPLVFRKRQPLIQSQDHLVIYRGLDGPGLI
jgi:hypothetical protein